MFLLLLKAFHFTLVEHNDDLALFNSVVQFLHMSHRMQWLQGWLDLETCPWELECRLIPELSGLCILHVRIGSLTDPSINVQVMQVIYLYLTISWCIALWSSIHPFQKSACSITSCLYVIHSHFAHMGKSCNSGWTHDSCMHVKLHLPWTIQFLVNSDYNKYTFLHSCISLCFSMHYCHICPSHSMPASLLHIWVGQSDCSELLNEKLVLLNWYCENKTLFKGSAWK